MFPTHKKNKFQASNLTPFHEMDSAKSTELNSGLQKYYPSPITSGIQSNSELSDDNGKIDMKS